jgi:hypothetical protein
VTAPNVDIGLIGCRRGDEGVRRAVTCHVYLSAMIRQLNSVQVQLGALKSAAKTAVSTGLTHPLPDSDGCDVTTRDYTARMFVFDQLGLTLASQQSHVAPVDHTA